MDFFLLAFLEGAVEYFMVISHKCFMADALHQCEGMFKKILSFPKDSSRPFLSGVEGKTAALLARGAYASYVSANAAKSGKSVSPKAAKQRPQVWRAAPAKPGNAAGGFFQHSHIPC